MAAPSTSRIVGFSVLGGFVAALIMAVIASMMLVPTSMGGQLFFVAAAMVMGMGSASTVAGWMLHLLTGIIIGAIFGVVVAKVPRLGLKSTGRALVLGAVAGIVVWIVFFMPMMVSLMPALTGMPTLVGGSFLAHIIYGLVLGGVASLAIPKGGSSFKCPTCGASFSSKDELMQHGKVHMSAPKQEFKCPACGMSFSTQQELMDHKAKAHPM